MLVWHPCENTASEVNRNLAKLVQNFIFQVKLLPSAECLVFTEFEHEEDLVPLWAVALGSVCNAEGLGIGCPCPSLLGAVVAEVGEVDEPSEKHVQNSDHFSVSE